MVRIFILPGLFRLQELQPGCLNLSYEALEKLEAESSEEEQQAMDWLKILRSGIFLRIWKHIPFMKTWNSPNDPSLPSEILQALLEEEGLSYAAKPKGLLKFHKYSADDRRTSFEEHLLEAVSYCLNKNQNRQDSSDRISGPPGRIPGRGMPESFPGLRKRPGCSSTCHFPFKNRKLIPLPLIFPTNPSGIGWLPLVQARWSRCSDPKPGCAGFRYYFYQQY